MTTFWPIRNPGVRYVRAEMPADALDARLLDFVEEGHSIDRQEGVGVWQLVADWPRFDAMIASQQRFGPALLEVDDDYTVWDDRYATAGWQERVPPRESVVSSVELHRLAAQQADGVIVSTPRLADVYSALNPRVWVCRNAVRPSDWPELPARDGTFRVVFAAGRPRLDVMMARRGLEWAARQSGVEVWVMGERLHGLRGVRSIGWLSSLPEFRRALVELRPDLGIRPVENTRFSRSKSDLKVLEYAMAGAASLVSSHDAYEPWRGTEVRFAATPREWEDEIRRAVRGRDRVREDAAALRARVLAGRTIEATLPEWRRAVESVRLTA